jgi:hypothetical protein
MLPLKIGMMGAWNLDDFARNGWRKPEGTAPANAALIA